MTTAAIPALIISAHAPTLVREAAELGGIHLTIAGTPAEVGAHLPAAAVVAIDGVWPEGVATVVQRIHSQHPGLPIVILASGSGVEIPAHVDDWLDLSDTTALELNLALRHAAERAGWVTALARGRWAGRLELLARIRGGVLAGLSEHLTVVLSHADLLAARIADPAGSAALGAVRGATTVAGTLVRQAQSFASRRHAVPTDLAVLLPQRAPLYAAVAGLAAVAISLPEGTSWIGVPPAEVDLLVMRLVLVAAVPGLALTVTSDTQQVVLAVRAPLPPEVMPAWTAIGEQASARGVHSEVRGESLCLVFQREVDADSHEEHLPHPARPGEHQTLEDARFRPHR